MKRKVARIFPFFDPKALDAGRFFFGTQYPKVEIFAGNRNLTAFLAEYDATHPEAETQEQRPAARAVTAVSADDNDHPVNSEDIIRQGERNDTMLRFAEKVLKHYGPTDESYREFLRESRKCEPPLDD